MTQRKLHWFFRSVLFMALIAMVLVPVRAGALTFDKDGIITISWTATEPPDFAGYNIYRSTVSGGPYTKLNASLVSQKVYTDSGGTHGNTYYYVVTAEDQLANASGYSPESDGVEVDMVAPTTTASPAGGLFTNAVSVQLQADEIGTIYYTLDGSTPTTGSPQYASPIAIASSTTLKFFAVDQADNRETVRTETYTIDTDIPTFSAISIAPDPAKAGVSLTIAFVSSEELSTNPTVTVGGAAATFSSKSGLSYNYTYAVLGSEPEGSTTITIRGTDLADNEGVDSSSAVVFDFTPPTKPSVNDVDTRTREATQIVTGGRSADTTTILVQGSSAGVTYPTPTSWSYTAQLQEGDNSFDVVAQDAAGNESAPETVTITLDTTPPDPPDKPEHTG